MFTKIGSEKLEGLDFESELAIAEQTQIQLVWLDTLQFETYCTFASEAIKVEFTVETKGKIVVDFAVKRLEVTFVLFSSESKAVTDALLTSLTTLLDVKIADVELTVAGLNVGA